MGSNPLTWGDTLMKICYYCETEFENNGSPFVACPNCGWVPADEENY